MQSQREFRFESRLRFSHARVLQGNCAISHPKVWGSLPGRVPLFHHPKAHLTSGVVDFAPREVCLGEVKKNSVGFALGVLWAQVVVPRLCLSAGSRRAGGKNKANRWASCGEAFSSCSLGGTRVFSLWFPFLKPNTPTAVATKPSTSRATRTKRTRHTHPGNGPCRRVE